MELSAYSYQLPDELIAKFPKANRDESRLMALNCEKKTIHHFKFSTILDLLQPGDVLVLNNTKVIKARFYARKTTGAMIEFLLDTPLGDRSYTALAKPAKRLKAGDTLSLSKDYSITILEKCDGYVRLQFNGDKDIFELLDEVGLMPIPPYIKDGTETPETFQNEYQTVFAKDPGAVAAPTAGLHFTNSLLEKLKAKGIQIETVTLHVGYGTFKPIKTSNITEHKMHSERYFVSEDTAKRLSLAKQEGRAIIAVGTTSVRTLESIATDGGFKAGSGETAIFIYPGYTFKAVDGLITNFHLPESSLLLLVSALAGRTFILDAYQEAVDQGYRFFSFGNAMFILPKLRNA